MIEFLRAKRGPLLLLCALAVYCLSVAAADVYPSKPIRIIVPVSAGGNLDLVTRSLADRFSVSMGQPVIVENKTGASSSVGTRFVATSPPDGYTLLAVGNTFVSAPAILPDIGYDAVAEFVGISLIARIPIVLVVPTNSPSQSVSSLIARAKARPGELSYASAGSGSTGHFTAEKFARDAGITLLHVPYKGNGPALIDVMGGRVDLMFDQVSTSSSNVRAGKLRALGVTTKARSNIFPEVPTLDESGLAGFEDVTFNALVAPAGTPREILVRLHSEIVKALQQPELRERFNSQGIELTPSASYEEFNRYMKSEVARYAKLARDANIKAD